MYIKVVENGYITAIGTGILGEKISESEYTEIMTVIQKKPKAEISKDYRLKADLTWEEYDLPVPSEGDEITDEEAFSILMGGES